MYTKEKVGAFHHDVKYFGLSRTQINSEKETLYADTDCNEASCNACITIII